MLGQKTPKRYEDCSRNVATNVEGIMQLYLLVAIECCQVRTLRLFGVTLELELQKRKADDAEERLRREALAQEQQVEQVDATFQ